MNEITVVILMVLLIACSDSGQGGRADIISFAKNGDLAGVAASIDSDKRAIFAVDDKGNTAVVWAILNGHNEVAKHIISAGYPINPRAEGEFPLIMACTSRYTAASTEMLTFLLENRANPNVRYAPEGWYALNMAVNNGMEDKVRILVEHGAVMTNRDRSGETPIELAQNRVKRFSDPGYDLPHGELSDPKVRRQTVERWESMVELLRTLQEGASKQSMQRNP